MNSTITELTKEDIQQIEQEHPSICFSCRWRRNPAATTNLIKGYVGCCAKLLDNGRWEEEIPVTEGEELAEGWVDTRALPGNRSSGVISNMQFLTKGIFKCKKYTKE